MTREEKTPTKPDDGTLEEEVGAGIGMVAGGAAGVLAGPLGIVVGASLGSIVGEAAGSAIHKHHEVPAAQPTEPAKLATFLRSDHNDLELLATTLMKTIVEGDREDVAAGIADLQARVTAHLDGEERDLLPRYTEAAPDDAAQILREHGEIRKALSELDVEVDLHLVRAGQIERLLNVLGAHAARENTGLYRWAMSLRPA